MIGDGDAEERDEGEKERPLNTRAGSCPGEAKSGCGCGCLAFLVSSSAVVPMTRAVVGFWGLGHGSVERELVARTGKPW